MQKFANKNIPAVWASGFRNQYNAGGVQEPGCLLQVEKIIDPALHFFVVSTTFFLAKSFCRMPDPVLVMATTNLSRKK